MFTNLVFSEEYELETQKGISMESFARIIFYTHHASNNSLSALTINSKPCVY